MSDQQTNRFHGMKTPHLKAVLLLTIFATGVLFIWWIAAQADREMRSELLRQTRLVAQPVNVQRVMSLLGTEADMDSPGYRRIIRFFWYP